MNNMLQLGSIVQLVTFSGEKFASKRVCATEDFWKLVGFTGKVVSMSPPKNIGQERVLIQFDVTLSTMGLHCHNETQNSLWIKNSDIFLSCGDGALNY